MPVAWDEWEKEITAREPKWRREPNALVAQQVHQEDINPMLFLVFVGTIALAAGFVGWIVYELLG